MEINVAQMFVIGGILFVGFGLLFWGREKREKRTSFRTDLMDRESMKQLLEKMESSRREVEELLITAQNTTGSLRRMINDYERTFCSPSPQDRSVSYVFNEMRQELRQELGEFQDHLQREENALTRFHRNIQETRKVA